MRVLEKIEQQNYNVLARRPAISKFERVQLLLGACGTRYRGPHERLERLLRLLQAHRPYARHAISIIRSCCSRGNSANAMCAIYAFMRYCDDISEGEGASREGSSAGVAIWICALAGQYGENPLWPAFHDTVQRYKIPHEYFYEMIEGVSSDLQPKQLQTFDELYRYCYQVASVVGLTIIHIFGFDSPEALAAGREMRHRVPVDQHPARCA